MTTRPMTSQKATVLKPESFRPGAARSADPGSAGHSSSDAKPRKIIAYYLNPACEHDWAKLESELQTLEPEGKIIWKCRSCSKITNTYDWQTP